MQKELDKFCHYQNHHKMRKQKDKILPSGCSPNFAYSCPGRFGAENCLQPVNMQVIDELLADLERDKRVQSDWGIPPLFAQVANQILREKLNMELSEVTKENAWCIFSAVHQRMETLDLGLLGM